MCSDAAQNGVPSCASKLLMTTKPAEWNATDDFFVVSDMGSYYNVYKQHKYSENTSDALLTDLQAGLDILYLRGGPKCNAGGDCPDGPSTTLQVSKLVQHTPVFCTSTEVSWNSLNETDTMRSHKNRNLETRHD